MDLKLKDVAELLHVSESTVRRWMTEGKISSYRLGSEVRFSRSEIEDWIVQHRPQKETGTPTARQFSLYRALNKGNVLYNVSGNTKEELILETCRLLAKELEFDPELTAELLLDREKMMPTALNLGLAAPHSREINNSSHVDAVAIVFPKKPIEYGALDGEPVHTLFFIFACSDKQHLSLLAKIAHLTRDEKLVATLKKRPTKQELLPLIKDWEAHIPS